MSNGPKASDDSELILAIARSDRTAYETIFRRLYNPLYLQVFFRTRDHDLTDDVVQEAFVRLWSKRSSLGSSTPLFPYLHAIALNLIRDHARHAVILDKYRAVQSPEHAYAPDSLDIMQASILQERINDIVNRHLSEKGKSVFVLSRVAGLSNSEIAELLQITLKSVENHLYHALKVLKKKLAKYQ